MRRTRKAVRSEKKRSWKRLILIILVILLAAAAFGAFQIEQKRTITDDGSPAMKTASVVHVMILGVDKRDGDAGRSDTMMVVTLNPEAKKAELLSVPRDTRVEIRGHGYEKINHAYAYGGHALSEKTVENLLGVPIDYYMVIDIHAFERIIDAIGGIDIDVEKRMHYEDPWDDDGGLVIDLYPGMQHMDGKKAVQYVRYRDGEGDIGRIGRQQKFMQAVLDKVVSPSILPRIPDIVKEVRDAIETDMPLSDMLMYAAMADKFRANGIESSMVPGKPVYIKDVSYWIPDIMALRQAIADGMGIKLEGDLLSDAKNDANEYEKSLPKGVNMLDETQKPTKKTEKKTASGPAGVTVLIINDSGIDGAGARTAEILKKKGFRISGVETGRTNEREKTIIVTSKDNTSIFYGMPFKCTIMDGGERNQAVVHIGRDFKR